MTSTDYIRKYADQNGLLIMDQLTFERITNNVGDQFRLDLADILRNIGHISFEKNIFR